MTPTVQFKIAVIGRSLPQTVLRIAGIWATKRLHLWSRGGHHYIANVSNTLLHRGCDHCASRLGRRWRHRGGRRGSGVVQEWYRGRSDLATPDAMVVVKFWACSKLSHKGRRGVGRSHVTQMRQEEGTRIAVVAEWMYRGRPSVDTSKMRAVVNSVYQFGRCFCFSCATIVPPLADQYRPLSNHCGDHCAPIRRPRRLLSHHGDGSASTVPPMYDHYISFASSRNKQGSCCSSYDTEIELSGFGRPLSVRVNFLVVRRWHEGVKGA